MLLSPISGKDKKLFPLNWENPRKQQASTSTVCATHSHSIRYRAAHPQCIDLPPRLPLMSPRESLSAHNEIPMMSSCKHQCQHLLEFGMSVAGHIVILCHVQNAVIHCARRRRKKDWKKNHCHCVVVCLPILLSSVL